MANLPGVEGIGIALGWKDVQHTDMVVTVLRGEDVFLVNPTYNEISTMPRKTSEQSPICTASGQIKFTG